jgi:sugar phosphate isomerase/epimerase
MPTRRYAVTASTFSTDPRDAVESVRKSAFDGVVFDAVSPVFDLTTLSDTGRREFRHVLSSRDLTAVALQVDVGPKGFGPGADLDRLLSRFDKVLQATAAIPGAMLLVETGPLPEPPRVVPPRPVITPEQAGLILIPGVPEPTAPVQPLPPANPALIAGVDTAMSAIGAIADRYSVMVAWKTELSSFAAIERALATADCPWFGVDLDPVAVLRDEWPMDTVFDHLGGRVRHVRGRDAVAGTAHRTRPSAVGRGDTAWDKLLADLDAADYAGWITFDPVDLQDRRAAAASGMKYLRLHEEP